MGRITSHIWNGPFSTCLKPRSSNYIYIIEKFRTSKSGDFCEPIQAGQKDVVVTLRSETFWKFHEAQETHIYIWNTWLSEVIPYETFFWFQSFIPVLLRYDPSPVPSFESTVSSSHSVDTFTAKVSPSLVAEWTTKPLFCPRPRTPDTETTGSEQHQAWPPASMSNPWA